MKAILTYTLFLIGTFAFSYMLIISADSEAQIQNNKEKLIKNIYKGRV